MEKLKKQKYKIEKNGGITLIALIITVIVILILAAISLTMLTGDNSILKRATDAKESQDRAQVLEIAKLTYMDKLIDNLGKNVDDSTALSAILVELQNEGYEVATVTNAGSIYDRVQILEMINTTGKEVDTISLKQTESTTLKVSLKMTEGTNKAYVKISGVYYELSVNNSNITLSESGTEDIQGERYTLKITPTTANATMKLGETTITQESAIVSGAEIKITALSTIGDETFTIKVENADGTTKDTKTGIVSVVLRPVHPDTMNIIATENPTSLAIGEELKLSVETSPNIEKITDTIVWSASNENATVDQYGVVTGKMLGTVTIMAKAKDGETVTKTALYNLTITPELTEGPNGKPLVNQSRFNSITSEKVVGEDKLGNQVVIPAGFKLAQGENGSGKTVKEGIVIEDDTGNQYVWIPVSNINGDHTNKIKVNSANEEGVEITLGRYTFYETTGEVSTTEGTFQYASSYDTPAILGGNPNASDSEKYYQELTTYRVSNGLKGSTGTNTTARGEKQDDNSYNGIKGFIESVALNKGYYVARYEASYRKNGKAGSIPSTSSTEQLALKNAPSNRTAGDLWNFIKQADAATACYDLYTTISSDLMNSYAWDTTLVYLQAMGNTAFIGNVNEEDKLLRNTGNTGDEKCKISDLISNVFEFTTEYSSELQGNYRQACATRGLGYTAISGRYAGRRQGRTAAQVGKNYGFRPILFL